MVIDGRNLRRPLRLLPEIKSEGYLWGIETECWVRRVSGRPPFVGPAAEAWFCPHPSGSPLVFIGDGVTVSLADLMTSHAEHILGATGHARFGGRFPFLAKVLSIAKFLSVQAHPDEADAIRLHALYANIYKDPLAKHEAGVAITDTRLLFGYRRINLVRSMVQQYPAVEKILRTHDLPTASSRAAVTELTRRAFDASDEEVTAACKQVFDRLGGRRMERLSPQERYMLRSKEFYPEGDLGVLFFFLLNFVHLEPGQGIVIPAGFAHMYCDGEVLEPQRNSNNVIRFAYTNKPKDKALALECAFLDVVDPLDYIVQGARTPGRKRYDFGNHGFGFELLRGQCTENLSDDNVQVLLSLDARGSIRCAGEDSETTMIDEGSSFLIPAGLPTEVSIDSGCFARFCVA